MNALPESRGTLLFFNNFAIRMRVEGDKFDLTQRLKNV